jgi:GDSL-like Lipase/Acylhydrolase family
MKNWLISRKSVVGSTALAVLLVVATATATMVLTNGKAEPVSPPADGPLRVAVIGDSYSAGSGNDVIWPALVAAGSPMSISNVAVADASYAGGAGQSGPFAQQIDKALASKPAVIVVFGGLGDAGLPDQQITQSATDLFAELIRRAPNAKLVAFGPIWHENPVPDVFKTLDADIAVAARTTHTAYVPLIGEKWLIGDGLMQGDSAPTDEGQLVLARKLNPLLLEHIGQPSTAALR